MIFRNKSIATIACLLVLLLAQFVLVQHTAEHGVLKHAHQAIECDAGICAQVASNVAASVAVPQNVAYSTVIYLSASDNLPAYDGSAYRHARAPPVIIA